MTYEDIRNFLNNITPQYYTWHDGALNDNSVLRITNNTSKADEYNVFLSMHPNYQIKVQVQCGTERVSMHVPYAEITDYISKNAQYGEKILTLSYERESNQYSVYRQLVEYILQKDDLEKEKELILNRFTINSSCVGTSQVYITFHDKEFGAYHTINFSRNFDTKFLGSVIIECNFFYDDSHNCGKFSLVVPLQKVNEIPLLQKYYHIPPIHYTLSTKQLDNISEKIKQLQDFPVDIVSKSAMYCILNDEIPTLNSVKTPRAKI